jgi:gas vesicle protein
VAEGLGALEYVLLGGIVGGTIGVCVGAVLTLLMMRRSGSTTRRSGVPAEERRRRVQSLMDRASQVMIAYSAVIDAQPGAMRAAVERMRAVGVGHDPSLYAGADERGVAEAARAFFALLEETQARVDQRVASGRPEAIAGELRARSEPLARAVARLHQEVARYTA